MRLFVRVLLLIILSFNVSCKSVITINHLEDFKVEVYVTKKNKKLYYQYGKENNLIVSGCFKNGVKVKKWVYYTDDGYVSQEIWYNRKGEAKAKRLSNTPWKKLK